jgi:hypothetical protein
MRSGRAPLAAVALLAPILATACADVLGFQAFSLVSDGGVDAVAPLHDSGGAPDVGSQVEVDAGVADTDAGDAGAPLADAGLDAFVDAGCTADAAGDPENCGACGHSCYGGDCVGGYCQPVTFQTGGAVNVGWGIATDGVTVSWVTPAGLMSCPAGGCTGGQANGPFLGDSYRFDSLGPLAINPSTGVLFAGCGLEDDAGGGLEVLAFDSDGGSAQSVQKVGGEVVVTADNDSLWYFVAGEVYRHAQSSAGPIVLFMSGLQSGTFENINNDAYNVYASDGNAVYACEKASSCVSSPTLIAQTGLREAVAGEPDGDYVYFGGGQYVYRCPSTGCASTSSPTPWVIHQGDVQDIAVDSSGVYWTDDSQNTVMTCPLGPTCESPRTIATNIGGPFRVTTDSTFVYWTLGDGICDGGQCALVQRVAK